MLVFNLLILFSLISCAVELQVEDEVAINETSLEEQIKQIENTEILNARFAKDWVKNNFYSVNNYSTPILPNGCTNFDVTYFVSTSGNDLNDGSSLAPFKTIQHAINQTNSNECSLINIASGDYYEALNISLWADGSGTRVFNKVTLFSSDRETTRIISKQSIDGWEKLNNEECPFYDDNNPNGNDCKIYKKRFDGHINTNYFFHYKDKQVVPMYVVGQYSFRDVIETNDLIDPTQLDNILNGSVLITEQYSELTRVGAENYKNHLLKILETDLSGLRYKNSTVLNRNDLTWNGVQSTFFVYLNTDTNGNDYSYIYFKPFDNEENPTKFLSTHIMYNLSITAQSNIVVQNLSFFNGRYGIVISKNSENIKVIGNKIENNYRSVYISGNVEGSPANIEVYGNQFTNNLSLNHSPQFEGAYRNFILVKTGVNDAHGVFIYDGGDNINIHHNFIYNVGNGIQSWTSNKTNFPSRNLKVHHNFIVNSIDDALEPGGDCQNCHWYANHLRNTSQAIRFKISNSNSTGPVFVYRNVFYNQDKYIADTVDTYSNQTVFYFHTPSEIPIYIYNNLFLGYNCFSPPTSSAWLYNSDGTQKRDEYGNIESMYFKLYFLNNILSCRYSMPNLGYGTWPMHYYNEETREYDVDNNEIAKVGQKNRQPLLSHNWQGGVTDHRTFVNNKTRYTNDFIYILAKDQNNDPLNYLYQSEVGNQPTHIFSNFGEDSNGLLRRLNFCPPTNRYPELINGGLNIQNTAAMSWNYTHELMHSNRTYYHLIDRIIEISLPGVTFNEDNHYIGPFSINSSSCDNLLWLLEEN